MIKNTHGGLLVAFDGPKGAGKTTLVEHVRADLVARGVDVWATKSPSDTVLGRFVREIGETIDGDGFACLIASDRYNHLRHAIIPKLSTNCVVITDRYVLSSLVLQRIDGVDSDFIINIHGSIIKPDLQIVVDTDHDVIRARLGERKEHKRAVSRFEIGNKTSEEQQYLYEGIELLKPYEIETILVNSSHHINSNVLAITSIIIKLL